MQNSYNLLVQAASNVTYGILLRPFTVVIAAIIQQENALQACGMCDRIEKAKSVINELTSKFRAKSFGNSTINLLIDLGRILGELEFAAVAYTCDVPIKPVQSLDQECRSKIQQPDFVSTQHSSIFFEVKTIARVDATANLKNLIVAIQQQNDYLQLQLANGSPVATSVVFDQPYAQKPYEKGNLRGVVEALSLKIISNLKPGQFAKGCTFLVVNLLDLPLYTDGTEQIRPVFWWNVPPVAAPTSGALWLASLGQCRFPYLFPPDFDGLPGLEGMMNFDGVLYDKSYVKGIFWLVHSLSHPLLSMATLRADDVTVFKGEDDAITWSIIKKLVDNRWNDEHDSNGWQLRGIVE